MFYKNREILQQKYNIIIKQLCISIKKPEIIYKAFATKLLEYDNFEFIG